jgi:tRNA G18 (ribose-2'-O)-methylase SpoU
VPVELIAHAEDPRLDDYRALRDPERRRQIDRHRHVFVAEGVLVLEALLRSPYRLRSVLVSTARAEAVGVLLEAADAPLYVVRPEILAEVAGFPLHRGVVALGERQVLPEPFPLVAKSRLVVVAEGVNDHENLGALYRNAAAFGVQAMLLDPTTADPLYRRCLRVSMGHALDVPTARLVPWPAGLERLAAEGWTVLALTPDPGAEPIDRVAPALAGARVALLVGAEGPGLSAGARAASGHAVRIPMAAGIDSLNLATAAAVALYVATSQAPGLGGSSGVQAGMGGTGSARPGTAERATGVGSGGTR